MVKPITPNRLVWIKADCINAAGQGNMSYPLNDVIDLVNALENAETTLRELGVMAKGRSIWWPYFPCDQCKSQMDERVWPKGNHAQAWIITADELQRRQDLTDAVIAAADALKGAKG